MTKETKAYHELKHATKMYVAAIHKFRKEITSVDIDAYCEDIEIALADIASEIEDYEQRHTANY
jgi:hypothetical protein